MAVVLPLKAKWNGRVRLMPSSAAFTDTANNAGEPLATLTVSTPLLITAVTPLGDASTLNAGAL